VDTPVDVSQFGYRLNRMARAKAQIERGQVFCETNPRTPNRGLDLNLTVWVGSPEAYAPLTNLANVRLASRHEQMPALQSKAIGEVLER